MTDIISLLILLTGILFACLVFANAIENLGQKLNLGHGATGSILAAVGTALPETLVPLVAIYIALKHGQDLTKLDIALGSIVGAPFMLATLALLVLAITLFIYKSKRKSLELNLDIKQFQLDNTYFLLVFSIAICAAFVDGYLRQVMGIALFASYFLYLYQTFSADTVEQSADQHCPDLYMAKFNLPSNLAMTCIQVIIGLVLIIIFAKNFVYAIEHAALHWDISPLLLSLIITPIATELPEKVNSCIWAREGKDTLAMGNITGAMVFQAAIPCGIGVLFTPWNIEGLTLLCTVLALVSALILQASLMLRKKIDAWTLLFGGILYIVYLFAVVQAL